MKCAYHPPYQVALPLGHPFPMSKYPRLLDLSLAEGVLAAADILQPEPLDACNLAGGTHHAFADHGEGFCALNDVAIAIRKLQSERAIERAAVIDLDVHQGDGTAAIFEAESEVFTFSMHGERNYPLAKMRFNVDVPLRDGVGDEDQRGPPTCMRMYFAKRRSTSGRAHWLTPRCRRLRFNWARRQSA
ncbi:MAG: arginase family protein [Steroidobacteraceae bacterium]